MHVPGVIAVLAVMVGLSGSQYNVGNCRVHFINGVYDKTVNADDLVDDGDYTVMYTNGLRQLKDVKCARFGYERHINFKDFSTYYSTYTKVHAQEKKIKNSYLIAQHKPGKFEVGVPGYNATVQYIAHRKNNIIMIYWCDASKKGTNDWYNNIWIIAAKSNVADTDEAKKAVLDMLYHNEFRHLIDRGTEDEKPETSMYIRLPKCKQ